GIPADSRAAKAHGFLKPAEITTERLEQIKSLNDIAGQRNQSLAQMAIAWLLKDKRVTTVLIGASSVTQLDNNLDALQKTDFNPDELKQIEVVLRRNA
ncbi:MAG TPA: aldo/keto reductase, partial [Chitinophagaceae bacterium]|nr:aldo/keto reductase [Chitinophagaceae bacterium]